jgi:hypothetical protein
VDGRAFRGLWIVAATLLFFPSAGTAAPTRDDTAWLQAKLDAGGSIFLPRLPNGECYATRGLLLTRDDTTITSDGACIVALGLGEGRIKRPNGTLIKANAVFDVDHTDVRKPLPVRVSISGLRITVPAPKRMHGISVFGHEVTLDRLAIDGAPLTDIRIGSGGKGAGGMTGRVTLTNSVLGGGQRDVVSISGPIGLRVEGNTFSGARGSRAAGLHIRAGDRGQPVLDVQVTGNKVVRNAGPGIYVDLEPTNGLPLLASGIEISRNEVAANARKAPKSQRGGIVLAGGQRDGKGTVVLSGNTFRANRGGALVRRDVPHRGTPAGPRTVAPASGAARRDDTAWLQARLDRSGGTVFLPQLPNGECYATRGLWVSHDRTTITSDGACVVSLGLGPVRLRSDDGDPIAASAVFFINRSRRSQPAPANVTISNLRIIVPELSGRANGNSFAGGISILTAVLAALPATRSPRRRSSGFASSATPSRASATHLPDSRRPGSTSSRTTAGNLHSTSRSSATRSAAMPGRGSCSSSSRTTGPQWLRRNSRSSLTRSSRTRSSAHRPSAPGSSLPAVRTAAKASSFSGTTSSVATVGRAFSAADCACRCKRRTTTWPATKPARPSGSRP